MQNYWRCECGHRWECEIEDFRLGAVVQCENCKVVWAHIRDLNGIKKWFPLDLEKAQSSYYNLLEPPEEEE
jgi:hypothetical protein